MKETDVIRVLLIDDDEDDYIITKDLLQNLNNRNYQLDWLDNAKAALPKMASNQYDVYLLDYRLASQTGLDLLKEAKQNGCVAPIIFLTGQENQTVDMEAMYAGAEDYLVKSKIDEQLLERSLRYAVQRAKMKQAIQHTERLQTAQKLAGAICHEFAQPLQIMSLSLTALKSNPDDKSLIDSCQQMVMRIGELVHKLRNITSVKEQPYLNESIIDLHSSSQPLNSTE
jgi:DNA-binding response OmpR family regulator